MASNFNILGTYSGITMDTIEQMIQAESGKVVQYTNEQKAIEAEKSAWKDVETRLSNLTGRLEGLEKSDTFNSRKVTSNVEGKVAFTATEQALPGMYEVKVSNLATRAQLTGGQLDMDGKKLTDAFNAKGTLTISLNREGKTDEAPLSISVTENHSLKDILTAINEQGKEKGISAVLIDNRIVFQSEEQGARTFSVTGEATDTLELGVEEITKRDGVDATFEVNGIKITRPTNSVSNAIEGITIELQGVTQDSVKVTIAENEDKTVSAVKAFVEQFNSTLSFIGNQLDVGDPSQENNKTGALSGDSSLMRLESQIRNLLTQPVDNGSQDVRSAKDIGITVDRYGTATLDESKLKEALKKNPQAVKDLFSFTKTETITENGTAEEKTEKIGISDRLKTVLESYTNSTDGVIKTRNETYDKRIKDLNQRIDVFNERLDEKRQRYIATFTALDVAMMEAESQMNYLASQVSGWSSNSN